MGRRRNKWTWKFWNVVASVAALFAAKTDAVNATTTTAENAKAPCSSATVASQLLLVSTLDGTMSALDLTKAGSLAWSVSTGSRPLLSSSISKLGIMRNGEKTRLIPSLDGGLYQYNGESIEAVPFTAETLLSSSFRLTENTVVVGGKELCSYGLEKQSGQVRYTCTVDGCKVLSGGNVSEEEDILMITRNTHTVRAVDSRTGVERWNFSVGQHEVHLFEGVKKVIETDTAEEDEDGISVVTCQPTGEEIGDEKDPEFDGVLKVIVPRGMVLAVSKTDPNKVLWKQEFPSPIASAWTINKGRLEAVNLFSEQNVPALTDSDYEEIDLPPEPLLYVGMHQDQLYVQPSVKMQELVNEATSAPFQSSDDPNGIVIRLPRVAWKPYLATAFSRTPALRVGFEQMPLIGEDNSEQSSSDSNAVAVWQEMYPYDSGCYLYPDFTPVIPLDQIEGGDNPSNTSAPEESVETISVTLWNWWKEVVAITVVTAVIVHMLTYRYSQRGLTRQMSLSENMTEQRLTESKSVKDLKDFADISGEKSSEYVSRYYDEFEHVRCLGKGGFGIVFEAKNKVDQCTYAMKRIALTNSETAKERVLREVRGLARLDHGGIVRYYQAWLETPPLGWQEERDRAIEDSECLTPTPCNSGTDLHSGVRTPSYINPFQPDENLSHKVDMFNLSASNCSHTGGFVPKTELSDMEESGSFSLGTGTPLSLVNQEDSFEVQFLKSDSESGSFGVTSENGAGDGSTLFHHVEGGVNNDSFSIVFEDSGCGDGQTKQDEDQRLCANLLKHSTDSLKESPYPNGTNQSRTTQDVIDSRNMQSKKYGLPKLYLFIQMQLCQRETLKDWLMANTLSRDRHTLLDFFDQIVTAVQYVHESGLMHRDLKPSNIFFSVDGVVKIGDFGLATRLSEQDASPTVGEGGDNHTAQVGTQLYMSPEQVCGKNYDQKVDIFSLGVILFELLYPFGTQMERVRTLQDVRKHKSPERFRREMPEEHKFVEWLLDHNPEKRPTAKEISESSLLGDFAVRHHVHKRVRSRTVSNNSNST